MRHSRSVAVLAGVCVGLLAFALYVKTLAPTVLYYDLPDLRDAAVLQVKAAVLGIPDYTGYPTYMMLGKLFTYLPVGDVAYRVNLASAVYAALAVLIVYMIGEKLTGRKVAAVAGALAFGVSQTFWSQAVIAEVYTLNAFFESLVIYVLLVWRERRTDRYFFLSAFLMGLSLTHHLTSGLLIPAGMLFVFLVERRKLFDVRLVLKGIGVFFLGLLPYAYLPIRASMEHLPKGWSWGQETLRTHPPNTLFGFFNLVSGGVWKGRMFVFGPEELPGRFMSYIHYLYGDAGQFSVVLVIVAEAGALYLLYRDRPAAVLLGFLYFGWLFHALEYDIEDIYYYFIPTYMILAVFMASGFDGILEVASALARKFLSLAGKLVLATLSIVILLAPLAGVTHTYRAVDRSDDYRGRYLIDTVAKKTRPDATVLHHRSPLYYMILVDHRREDLHLINYIELPDPLGLKTAVNALKRGPVYVLFPSFKDTPYFVGADSASKLYRKAGYELVPTDKKALLYQVLKSPSAEHARQDDGTS